MSQRLNEEEALLVETVREFVDREVKPTVHEVEHANEYPENVDRADEADRHLRAGDTRGVRRLTGVDALLRRRSPRNSPAAG